jgi:hypothetical protein
MLDGTHRSHLSHYFLPTSLYRGFAETLLLFGPSIWEVVRGVVRGKGK